MKSLITQLSDYKIETLTHEQLKNLIRDFRADAQAIEKNMRAEKEDCEIQLLNKNISQENKDYLAGYRDALQRDYTAEGYIK